MTNRIEEEGGMSVLGIFVIAAIVLAVRVLVSTEEVPVGTFWDQCTLLEVRVEPTDALSGLTRDMYKFDCDGVIREYAGYDPRGKVGYKLVWSDWVKEKFNGN
jgi:hypothetical protein